MGKQGWSIVAVFLLVGAASLLTVGARPTTGAPGQPTPAAGAGGSAPVYLPLVLEGAGLPTPTPTATPTATATDASTATPTASATPTGIATATPTSTATPSPTSTATAPPTATATTTPTTTPTTARPYRLAVIGDFGMDNAPEADVASLVASWAPDAVATTGDNNYPDGSVDTIDANIGQYYHAFIGAYTGVYGAGSAENRFFPVLGNHDWRTVAGTPPLPYPHLDYFSLPAGPGQERYYDAVIGPIHLFGLDSDAREPDGITSASVQAEWLRAGLAASTAPWKLVFLHHPPYSSSSVHGSTPDLQWPYKAWGATAVLAGHDHTYERLAIDGLPYFVNGIGGAALYDLGAPLPGSQAQFNTDYGAMLIEATPLTITFQLIDRTGIVRDRLELTPTAPITEPVTQPITRTVTRRVAASADDAEERTSDQSVNLTSTDLELTVDPGHGISQTVGVHFAGVTLPATATIVSAYLEFVVDETGSNPTTLAIAGERRANPAGFAATNGDLSRRPRTVATVAWSNVPAWPTVGAAHRTPDLASIVQEQIGQPGWAAGNALVFLITGEGRRTAEAFDGQPGAAALLHVEYTLP